MYELNEWMDEVAVVVQVREWQGSLLYTQQKYT